MTANGNAAVEAPEKLPAEVRASMLEDESSVFLNVAKWEQMQRAATMLSVSDFVPSRFRGKMGNCMIALDMAHLMGMHPLMLMRCMYVVHGEPGFEGKFASALVNNSNRYTDPLEYEWKGVRGKDEWGCRAFATRKSTGKVIYGPWVDWAMVKKEGWDKPKGSQTSKWLTMPEIMFMYRSATFFARVHDSDLLMGMKTVDELEDVHQELSRQPDGSYSVETTGKVQGTCLYNTTQEPPKQEEPTTVNVKNETNATVTTQERQTETGTEVDVNVDRPAHTGDTDPKDPGPWAQANWNNLKGPGVKALAENNSELFMFQPPDIRKAFAEKWGRCKELEALRFPFTDAGIWRGYLDPTETKTETQEAGQVSSDSDPEGTMAVEMEMLNTFNELWISIPKDGKEFACTRAECKATVNGFQRPSKEQMPEWIDFAKEWMADNINDDSGDGEDNLPFDNE